MITFRDKVGPSVAIELLDNGCMVAFRNGAPVMHMTREESIGLALAIANRQDVTISGGNQ